MIIQLSLVFCTKSAVPDPVPSRSKVGIPTLSTVTHTFSRPVNTAGSFSTAIGLNLPVSSSEFCEKEEELD
jgi:hypothetical protein